MKINKANKKQKKPLDPDKLLRFVSEGTSSLTGEQFFRVLVRKLAEILDVHFVFIAEFCEDKTRVRALAFWEDGDYRENIEYFLAGTPCEEVLAGKKCFYEKGVKELFPEDKWLRDVDAEGYLATPLIDSNGSIMGHLAVLDNKPMNWHQNDLSVFDIFASRATAELERLIAGKTLLKSQKWLETILSGSLDGIIVIDDNRNITLFNTSAKRLFRCQSEDVMGKSLDPYLSNPLKIKIMELINSHLSSNSENIHFFIPDGLIAIRSDGENFPIEATLSALPKNGTMQYVFVLRDELEKRKSNLIIEALSQEKAYLEETMNAAYDETNVVIGSRAMHQLLTKVHQVAKTDATVLLLGETGTGKELIAHTIHNQSKRNEKILVKVNCAAFPEELIESELFGHEKGAFTGAITRRKGRFELANGGTLFLDEIGELSPAGQAKLLRVLQEQEFERVGGSETVHVNVRVIAATNRDLSELVTAGKFRSDLFYRLNVFPISIPALRERLDDLPKLIIHFLGKLERKLGKSLTSLSKNSLERMYLYSWPGNVRELQNLIERAAILATTPVVEIGDLEIPETSGDAAILETPYTLRDMERKHILKILDQTNWVVEGDHGAAALLDMNPSTLRYRMQKLDIQRTSRHSLNG